MFKKKIHDLTSDNDLDIFNMSFIVGTSWRNKRKRLTPQAVLFYCMTEVAETGLNLTSESCIWLGPPWLN